MCAQSQIHTHTSSQNARVAEQAGSMTFQHLRPTARELFLKHFFLLQVSLINCVIRGMSLNLLGPQFPHLYKGGNNSTS